MTGSKAVTIHEVSPRDGLQSIAEPLPTETKIEVIQALISSGLKRIEIGSFVSPKAVPQMADMKAIAETFSDLDFVQPYVLVPNIRGAELALCSGIRNLVYVFSASETHNYKNVRQTIDQSIDQLAEIQALLGGETGINLRIDIGTAFDCPFDGEVPFDSVRQAVQRISGITPKAEIALCDTTGKANPFKVRSTFQQLREAFPPGVAWAFHGHDTYGLGVANALFAYDAGVKIFDASAAGLGGCPFAPGATGNTATEDLTFAFEGAGISTGVDMHQLLQAADMIDQLPGGVTSSHLRHVPRDRVFQHTTVR